MDGWKGVGDRIFLVYLRERCDSAAAGGEEC